MKWSSRQRRWFLSASLSVIFALLATFLTSAFLAHWLPDFNLERWGEVTLSERSLNILQSAQGHIQATAIFPKDSQVGIAAGRLLRTFAQNARNNASMEILVDYVDPRIDLDRTANFKTLGAKGEGIFLQHAGQTVFIPAYALCCGEDRFHLLEAEQSIAAGIHRMARGSIKVGWLTGHNEPSFQNTDLLSGLSGFARILQNQGLVIEPVTLDPNNSRHPIPEDIRILFLIAPEYPLTRDETAILHDWVNNGGRLFCTLPAKDDGGIAPLVERWGIEIGLRPILPERIDGNGAGLTRLLSKTHPITQEFNASVMMTFVAPRPLFLTPPHQIKLDTLVQMPNEATTDQQVSPTIMAAIEQSATMGEDLTLRTGRAIVCGDSHFIENRYLMRYATANRDLVVNAVSWLAGTVTDGQQNLSNILRVGQDAKHWRRDFLLLAGLFPLVFIACIWLLFRRRS